MTLDFLAVFDEILGGARMKYIWKLNESDDEDLDEEDDDSGDDGDEDY